MNSTLLLWYIDFLFICDIKVVGTESSTATGDSSGYTYAEHHISGIFRCTVFDDAVHPRKGGLRPSGL